MEILKGSTDISVTIRIIDSTDGTPEQAVEHDESGIALWYRRDLAIKTTITPVALAALTTAHSDGGIEHIDDGYYRLDVPDEAFATGVDKVVVGGTITGMQIIGELIELTDVDKRDAVRGGMTALPNAAAEAAGGLYTRGTGAGQIRQQTNGQIDANTERVRNAALNVLVSGRMDSSTGAMAANVITAAAIATGAFNTEILEALENAGLIAQRTTITSLTSQVLFQLTAGSSDDNTYRDGIAVIEDASTAAQKGWGLISAYDGGTKAITLRNAIEPSDFVIANGDIITIIPPSGLIDDAIRATTLVADTITAGKIAANAIGTSEFASALIDAIRDAIISDGVAFLGADIPLIKTQTDKIDVTFPKNTAKANFHFLMTLAGAPVLGLTSIVDEMIIDEAGKTTLANNSVEVANGVYRINLDAADLNGDIITLIFTHGSADQTTITVGTSS